MVTEQNSESKTKQNGKKITIFPKTKQSVSNRNKVKGKLIGNEQHQVQRRNYP